MLRRQLGILLASLLVAGALVYGIVQLFSLRLSEGDVYPPYSSPRADPLGTKAFLDALNLIPGVRAWRNYLPLQRTRPSGSVALVYIGLPHNARWSPGEREHFETLITSGSRAIFAFAPAKPESIPTSTPEPSSKKEEAKKEEDKKGNAKKDEARKKERMRKMMEDDQERTAPSFTETAKRWGFRFIVAKEQEDKNASVYLDAELQDAATGLEAKLPWRGALHFGDLAPHWKTLYGTDGRALLIERRWGRGSIVLASDSYFLSNEALREETRAPKLLTWLIGSQRDVIFDEEHLGIAEQSGVATLARKYRLHGLVAGLALLALLFIWQNMVRFTPPLEEDDGPGVVSGRGSSEGFLALLRRSVPVSELLPVSLREWRRTFGSDQRALQRLDAAYPAAATMPRKAPEIYATYCAITRAVQRKSQPATAEPVLTKTPSSTLKSV